MSNFNSSMQDISSIGRPPKVLLVEPGIPWEGAVRELHMPLGLVAIASYLRNMFENIDVNIWDANPFFYKKSLSVTCKLQFDSIKLLNDTGPLDEEWDIIGVANHFSNSENTTRVAEYLRKKYPNALIVLGGVHASACYEAILKTMSFIDGVVTGEGELALCAIVKTWMTYDGNLPLETLKDIPNFAFRDHTNNVQRSKRQFLDLDVIGAYDWRDIDISTYRDFQRKNPSNALWVESGRGCTHACAFCISARYWGHQSRYFKVDKVIADLKTLTEAGISNFLFTHDQFTANRFFVLALCKAIKLALPPISWWCYSRIDEFPNELLPEMAAAGCKTIFSGLESGQRSVQSGLAKIVEPTKLNEIIEACNINGIQLDANIIFGFHEHDDETVIKELAFCVMLKEKNIFRLSLSPLSVYPTTKLGRTSKDFGFSSKPVLAPKVFFGLPAPIFVEVCRVLVTFFPVTLKVILSRPFLLVSFKTWLKDKKVELEEIHFNEKTDKFDQFLLLFFSLCRLDTEALAFAVQECATALVSIDWSQDFAWQDSDRRFAIEYKYQSAISTCSIAFDEEGKMIPTASVNSFEIRNSLEGDLVIEQRETERRRA